MLLVSSSREVSYEYVVLQDSEEALWWRGSAAAGSGACACWCAQWAELHVRAPTGDVCWLLRLQNQVRGTVMARECRGACACWCAQWAELHVRAPITPRDP